MDYYLFVYSYRLKLAVTLSRSNIIYYFSEITVLFQKLCYWSKSTVICNTFYAISTCI